MIVHHLRRMMRRFFRDSRGSSDLNTYLLLSAAGCSMVVLTAPSLFNSSKTASRAFDKQVQVLERGSSGGGGGGGVGGGGGGGGGFSMPSGGGGAAGGVSGPSVNVSVGSGGVSIDANGNAGGVNGSISLGKNGNNAKLIVGK